MLIEFRVRNFKSIRDEQVLSLVASKDKALRESHVVSFSGKVVPDTLRGAVLYGANASGKSNLLQAFFFMQAVVANSATHVQPGAGLDVPVFRLDKESLIEPAEFEVTFTLDGVRYQYGFSLTADRVMEEWLLVYRTSKPQQWFTRTFDVGKQEYDYSFSAHLTGQRKVWQASTRRNALFLSTAVQLNSDLLRPIFSWIVRSLVFFGPGISPAPEFSTRMLLEQEGKQAVFNFLSDADIGMTGIDVTTRKGRSQSVQFDLATGKTEVRNEEGEILVPQFQHVTEHGEAVFELHEESLGTQRLFALAGPILDILNTGRVLIVDELDASLHPLLVRRLVGMFHSRENNPYGAQIIFTTHDTTLLSQEVFRRDQVWFLEKDRDQATILYPLTDFSPRKSEVLERGYLIGRYGAVPFFNDPVED